MLLIKKNDFELHSASRLVKAEEIAAVRTAQETIEAAEAKAAEILKSAQEAFSVEQQRGYEKGLEDGKREISTKKLALQTESVQFMESMERKMTDIVIKALRKCITHIGDQEIVVQIVHKLMDAMVRNQQQITLKVAAEMVPVVKARMERILADYPTLTYVDVQEDSRLHGTACIIETEAGMADASMESQIEAIEAAIRQRFAKER